ncbi:4Fe-4S dicluster domain-containing protein [Roseococcus sp. YIM B11640]|uniref:4Fe-4S dicluster domain-containing protein n=1 Tax=Roseococcus sp. YIM B11640 TaxID=3133973 RepID=UPI003C7A3C57
MTTGHANLSELRESETARMLAACSECGACFDACPMVPYAPDARGAEKSEAVRGVLDVLTGGQGNAAARGWIAACTRSGSCNEACPEAVNPMLMLRLAKWRASETGALPKRDSAEVMSRVKVFARLSFTEEEQRDWL